jgi:diguanylate cyclase (GGDEF)-like protein
MGSTQSQSTLANLPSAFAAACRISRSDSELFERCREVLTRRFSSERIWLTLNSPIDGIRSVGPGGDDRDAVQVAQLSSGEAEVTIRAEPKVAELMRSEARPIAIGLSVVLELRSVLVERQSALDDAVFQLRALRQVTRLLSSVHSSEDTERLILDFMAEVFFTWWACLYRPSGKEYVPVAFRSRHETDTPDPIPHVDLEKALPPGSLVTTGDDVAIAALLPADTQLVFPLDAGAERLAVLAFGPRLNDRPYGRPEHELAATLAFAAAIALKNSELVERLHSAATTDELTGLYNRRALEERLEAELSRGVRHDLHTTVVLIDIDRFKPINDTLGHAAGDRFLALLADVLREQCRTLDVVGRLGGDEFLVVLPMTSAEEGLVFVRRVQAKVAEIGKMHPEFGQQTISLGVSESPKHGANVGTILAAADAALYQAKRAGRNTVALAVDVP